MPVGCESLNDSNYWLIDGNTPNMVFLGKGQAVDSVTFQSPSYPMVFIRPAAGYLMGLVDNGGGSYTYRCKGSFQYWIFANKTDQNAQRYGLQVFGSSGDLLYGSFENPLKIHALTTYARGKVPTHHSWFPDGTYRTVFGTPVAAVVVPNSLGRLLAYAPNTCMLRGVFASENGSYSYGRWWTYAETFVVTETGYRIEETRWLKWSTIESYNYAQTYQGDYVYWGNGSNPSVVDEWIGIGPVPPRISNQSSVLVADVTGL